MSRTARLLAIAASAVALTAVWPAGPAAAHPLGNFTINVYGGVVVRPEGVIVDYIVDMAEIPAFRERRTIDANLDDRIDAEESRTYRGETCGDLAEQVSIDVGGTPLSIQATGAHALSFPSGAGGLSTMRLECRFEGLTTTPFGDTTAITYADRNFPDSIGWREVTAVGDRVTIVAADVSERSSTDRLRTYDADALPLDVRTAAIEVRPGGPSLGALPTQGSPSGAEDAPRDAGPLASLLGAEDLTPLLVAAMVGVALGVGALHALGPGHGKTLIGAYLVGAGGSLRHAVGVGAAVSVMHTASVLGLGVLVLSAERALAPERVYPLLGMASGLIAVGLGSTLLVARIHARTHDRDHGHPHPHGHAGGGHAHTAAGAPLSRRGMLALAVSGGVLPSPTALVTLLAAVSLGRTALGLLLIAAFSVGLAGALIAVGFLTIRARDLAARRFADRTARLLPVASAAAIAAMGVFLTVQGALRL